MSEPTEKRDWADLAKMKEIIDRLEGLLLDLKELGREMPVVEKNVQALMSFIQVLKFGLSDIAETGEKKGGC